MPKRVVTKVGDIFRTKETTKGRRYLQLVAIDKANMNSDVIVVFKASSEIDSKEYDELAQSAIELYCHTTVSQGVKQGLWEKVGKAPVSTDLSKLVFKYYRDQSLVEHYKRIHTQEGALKIKPPFNVPFWDTWSIPEERYHSVSGQEGARIDGEDGGIVPARDIIYRIEHGVSGFMHGWPL